MAGPVEKRGLLIVHGMGEQKRFDHLKTTVLEFAELIRQFDPPPRVSVLDRTDGWKCAPGEPDPASGAPISLSLIYPEDGRRDIEFECHEVWWADLGAKSGVGEVFTFWIWGLGQWGAPIYETLDCAHVRKPGLVWVPRSVAGEFRRETWARCKLSIAALAAIFTLMTWSIAKRLFSALLGQVPSPVLIEQYIGDVRTYEQRAMPGHADVTDPGMPLRVGIRRRMVTEMVAMAMRDIQSWHVVAHSQGTVLAYNGLTEIGHTLPNYLSQRLWNLVMPCLRSDPGCRKREKKNLPSMIPARPGWLDYDDVINRPALFAKLHGVLTYGSPLEKFVALWPRIIATAIDRTDRKNPFRDIVWLNLAAPQDPVAGLLESFGPKGGGAGYLPKLCSHATQLGSDFGTAHLNYFKGKDKTAKEDIATKQKKAVVEWLLDATTVPGPAHAPHPGLTKAWVWFGNTLCVAVLWLAATLVFTLGHGVLASLAGYIGVTPGSFAPVATTDFGRNLVPVAGLALSLIAVCGLYRWARESRLNLQLARDDPEQKYDVPLFEWQRRASMCLSPAICVLLAAALVKEFALAAPLADMLRACGPGRWIVSLLDPIRASFPRHVPSYRVAILSIAVAIFLQARINRAKKPRATALRGIASQAPHSRPDHH